MTEQSLQATVARLADRQEITDVLYRYTDLLDRGEFDRMAEAAFTVDAVEDHGVGRPIGRGRAEIADARRQRHQGAGSMHVVSNVLVEFTSPDDANVQSYIRTYVWRRKDAGPEAPVDFVLIGLFLDRFTRTPEGWRIAHRRRRNIGPSPMALGEMPGYMTGTSGPRQAPTKLDGYDDAFTTVG